MSIPMDMRGMTLVEVVLVVIIIGVLATVAFRSGQGLFDASRIEETKQEMHRLSFAVAGNPTIQNNGVRSDFGYVGDVGSMPPNLDALISNPGGYSTWNGPYIGNRFEQTPDDYKKDAWGAAYAYGGGILITSTGGGSNIIVRVASATSDLLYNEVSGNVFDLDGTPPGESYSDSVTVYLTVPDGAGSTLTRSTTVDMGGYFAFDSVPVGNHDIQVVYQPNGDTIRQFVSVLPRSSVYNSFDLPRNVWYGSSGSGGIQHVAGSDTLVADCHGFYFWVENVSGSAITVDGLTLSWSSPTAYYRYVLWDGTTVFNSNNPKAGSGETISFSAAQVIAAGESLKLEIDGFKENQTGGSNVDMENVSFSLELSDESVLEVQTGACP